jgi:hypothetical protein
MIENELKRIWQDAAPEQKLLLDKTRLLVELDHFLNDFEKGLKNRDRREITVAALMIPVLALVAIIIPFLLSKIAMWLLIPWCGFVIYKLKAAKKHKPADPSLDMRSYLIKQKNYLLEQRKLIGSVLYWYLLPPTALLLLFFAGFDLPAYRLIMHCSIVLAVNGVIYYLNRRAIKTDFDPALKKIDDSLVEFEISEP